MRTALMNGRILIGEKLVSGVAVLISGGRIEALAAPSDARCRYAATVDLAGRMLLPGFIDVQVNGGGGALFNDEPSAATIRTIGEAHRRFGTTGFLPTLISDDLGTIGRAITAVQSSLDEGIPGVLGIHIEGPFLNWARRGVHDPKHLRLLDTSVVSLLCRLRAGKTVLTLAPEMTTPDMIAELAAGGVLVSAGHSNATFAETTESIARGLRGFTHLFNAMAPLAPRAPGIRCKRHDRFMLVTDGMPPVGSAKPTFVLQGRTIRVVDGACRDENGTLAGTALDMASAVRNAVSSLGLGIVAAARMASEYPAEFLGLGDELGRIAPGYRANLVLVDDDIKVQRTWIEGNASP
jgi:N-acetylglucosamine-6-phosphate deacetylase